METRSPRLPKTLDAKIVAEGHQRRWTGCATDELTISCAGREKPFKPRIGCERDEFKVDKVVANQGQGRENLSRALRVGALQDKHRGVAVRPEVRLTYDAGEVEIPQCLGLFTEVRAKRL